MISAKISNFAVRENIISTIYGDLIISIFISNLDDLNFNFDNKGIELGGKIVKIIYDNFINNKGKLN